MPDPINVTIGGEVIALPPILNFTGLERAWPAIKAVSATTDAVEQIAAGIGVISAALVTTRPELTVPEIKARLRVDRREGRDERPGLMKAMDELLRASGLVVAGEDEPPAAPTAPAA